MAADRFSVPCTWIDEAKKNGIGYATLRSRLMYGWTPEDAMNTPLRKRRGKRVEKPKLKYSIEEIERIARENGESYGVTVARLDGYLR